MDHNDDKRQISTLETQDVQPNALNTTKATDISKEIANLDHNDDKRQAKTLEKKNVQTSAHNTTKAADVSGEEVSPEQNSEQQDSIDKFKEEGTKARLEAKNKRKAAENALAEINNKQQENMKTAMKPKKLSADLPEQTVSKSVKTAPSSNTEGESNAFLSESEVANSLNSLLIEKIKTSHQLQMNKLIADIEAVMLKEPAATKVEKDND
jgi:hypothetical protein